MITSFRSKGSTELWSLDFSFLSGLLLLQWTLCFILQTVVPPCSPTSAHVPYTTGRHLLRHRLFQERRKWLAAARCQNNTNTDSFVSCAPVPDATFFLENKSRRDPGGQHVTMWSVLRPAAESCGLSCVSLMILFFCFILKLWFNQLFVGLIHKHRLHNEALPGI